MTISKSLAVITPLEPEVSPGLCWVESSATLGAGRGEREGGQTIAQPQELTALAHSFAWYHVRHETVTARRLAAVRAPCELMAAVSRAAQGPTVTAAQPSGRPGGPQPAC
jgi:hypothetical protein